MYRLVIRYIAINSTFPFHLNVLSNANLYSGNINSQITTITSFNYGNATKNQSLPYTNFSNATNSYSNYIVVCYLTCLAYKGAVENGTTKYPPVVNIAYKITSPTNIDFTLTLGMKANISTLHYTFIVYDKYQI
jgi:hypothetical protein